MGVGRGLEKWIHGRWRKSGVLPFWQSWHGPCIRPRRHSGASRWTDRYPWLVRLLHRRAGSSEPVVTKFFDVTNPKRVRSPRTADGSLRTDSESEVAAGNSGDATDGRDAGVVSARKTPVGFSGGVSDDAARQRVVDVGGAMGAGPVRRRVGSELSESARTLEGNKAQEGEGRHQLATVVGGYGPDSGATPRGRGSLQEGRACSARR